ncbi:MAG: winged helix-turn-helix transcriptional regulator [Chloroflexi bacterium]|nr:winged helix-turn-helix transcriptional regulator [Chloroflexota bacterium]
MRRRGQGEYRLNDPLRLFKADLFKALGHPARLQILELLRDRERSVSELQAGLQIAGSAVSQQLMVLRSRQLVEARREGANVYYRVRDPAVFTILDAGREIFAARLDELRASLARDVDASRTRGELLNG